MYEFKQKIRNLNLLSEEQRFLWEERVAICMIDGGVNQERAGQIAWEEIDSKVKKVNLILKGI